MGWISVTLWSFQGSLERTTKAGMGSHKNPAARVTRDCGDLEIAIQRDGTWLYRGTPIGRMPLVKLFASVLERDEEGVFWMRTPVEKGTVRVEDAPFVAVALDVEGSGREQVLRFRTNMDDTVEAGPDHAIRLGPDAASGVPIPYILVRKRLEARVLRSVYYDLVELGCEEDVRGTPRFGVWSKGTFFPLDEEA
jgi:uncharacterized protein